ncbi:MAG: ABC transporter permease [Longimicrobiales bacterium]
MTRSPEPPRRSVRILGWVARTLETPELVDDAADVWAARVARDGEVAADRWYRSQVRAGVVQVVRRWAEPGRATGPLRRGAEGLARQLRFAARRLRRQPLEAATFAGVVGLGIAAAAFMYQTRSAMLHPDLGLGRTVHLVQWIDSAGTRPVVPLTGSELWLDDPHPAVAAVAPLWVVGRVLDTPQGLVRASGQRVRGGFLEALGATPLLGRDVRDPGDVVLSYRLWHARWDASASAIGSPLDMNGRTARVVGVAPEGFDGPICCAPPDYWVVDEATTDASGAVVALVDVRDERAAAAWLADVVGGPSGAIRADLVEAEAPSGGYTGVVARTMTVLLGLAGLAWITTLLSGVNLQLTDALGRRGELRLRRALGAGAREVILRTMAETAWLSLLAAGVAVAAVAVMIQAAPWFLPMIGATSSVEVVFGRQALLAALGAAAVGTVVCALPAALLALAMSRETRLERGPGSSRFAAVGLGVQLGLAGTVLTLTGILLGTVRTLDGSFVGFRHGATAVHLVVAPERDDVGADELIRGIRGADPAASAALSARLPVYGWRPDSVTFADGSKAEVAAERVTPGFFEVIGSRLVAGAAAVGDRDAVVSADLAARLAATPADALGRTLVMSDTVELQVVGVVEEATWGSGRIRPTVYQGWGTHPVRAAQLLVRRGTEAPPLGGLLGALRPMGVALQPFATLDALLVRSRVLEAFMSRLATVFAVLCLAVALGGVHAHFVRWVRARRRTLAIHAALGAQTTRLGRGIALAGLRIVVPGALFGCFLGGLISRVAPSFVVGLAPARASLLVGTLLVLVATGLLAMLGPVLRAGRTDPLELFRGG